MEGPPGGGGGGDALQKIQKPPLGLAGLAVADDPAGLHVPRGEQRNGAMAEVVVRVALGPVWPGGSDGCERSRA